MQTDRFQLRKSESPLKPWVIVDIHSPKQEDPVLYRFTSKRQANAFMGMLLAVTVQRPTNPHKYIAGEWCHFFPGDKHERLARAVLDAHARKLAFLQVLENRAIRDSYHQPTSVEFDNLQDSLVNANGKLFDDPMAFGLYGTDDLPAWAI
ncbi:hypothetical protein [Azomonas macrocytogenes]|uniref:Uncharacterized protein n=1 Tax=Azomonas macrocytogenes TaxID=69962 RepID=A0A839TAR6_AZOMA|nr:hypothetical protein [Azomonas macrocytogenes]MBB3105234.1 hypothetical protein [Azomonas macrocytogenes]